MIWDDGQRMTPERMTPMGWLRLIRRGVPLAMVVFGGLLILLTARLIERPLAGHNRPVTPWITVFVCRAALWIIGIRRTVSGTPMQCRGAMVANHGSWLDIFALNALGPLYFVSKAEVARWPAIGWLARATGTVFIERRPSQSAAQTAALQSRFLAGHRLLFFPEGTSSDGRRILPFKTTLFEAFFARDLRDRIAVQPVTVIYHAPGNADPRFYGWWGDMSFGGHILRMLSAKGHGCIDVVCHDPVLVKEAKDRKALALMAYDVVKTTHQTFVPQDEVPHDNLAK